MGTAPSSPSKEKPNWRRIRKELHKFWVDPPPFCRPGPSPVTDLLHWEVVIDGPEDSPYAGGTFAVDVDFPCGHPHKPVKITFKTKVTYLQILLADRQSRLFVSLTSMDRSIPCPMHL
jgi:ubiquitin-protein ligase